MNKPFDIHRLYRNLDKWKLLHRKQINMKHTLKKKYFRLKDDYKDLFGYIKGFKNINVTYLHAREIVERLGDGSLDIGFSGYDLLKESEINIQKQRKKFKKKTKFISTQKIKKINV